MLLEESSHAGSLVFWKPPGLLLRWHLMSLALLVPLLQSLVATLECCTKEYCPTISGWQANTPIYPPKVVFGVWVFANGVARFFDS
jgi:hypothetical protein